MTTTMESNKQIEEQASFWLAKRDLGSLDEAGQAALDAWLAASTANLVAFLRLEAGWTQAGRLAVLAAGSPNSDVPERGDWQRPLFFEAQSDGSNRHIPSEPLAAEPASHGVSIHSDEMRRRPGWWSLAALAASILLVVAGTLSWALWPRGQIYRTAVGGLEAVPMSDGSKVTLNTDTGILVAMKTTERGVDLQKGEAYFEVAKDPSRPFVVRTDSERITAVGTKFSVRRDVDGVHVVVTEGRVRVESLRRRDMGPGAFVSAGEVASAGDAGAVVEKVAISDAEDYLSWLHGFVVFRNTPLRDVVAQFNRYSIRKIVIGDPSIDDIQFSGSFRSSNAAGFLRLMANGLPIRLEQRGDQVILSRQ
jgi:transmembrane sensor